MYFGEQRQEWSYQLSWHDVVSILITIKAFADKIQFLSYSQNLSSPSQHALAIFPALFCTLCLVFEYFSSKLPLYTDGVQTIVGISSISRKKCLDITNL